MDNIINLANGKPFSRRDGLRGLAAILAAGCAPTIARAAAGGLVRGAAARGGMLARNLSATIGDYVTSGLISMWDGENNAGWGVHDASATTWKDLIGSQDLTKNGGTFYDTYAYAGGASNFAATYTSSATPWTIEAVVSMPLNTAASQSWFIFVNSGTGYYNTPHPLFVGNIDTQIKLTTGTNGTTAAGALASTDYANGRIMSLSYSEVAKGPYVDGVANIGSGGWIPESGTEIIWLGRNSTASNRTPYGKIYNVRLYSRALTDRERERNYLVDRARFGINI